MCAGPRVILAVHRCGQHGLECERVAGEVNLGDDDYAQGGRGAENFSDFLLSKASGCQRAHAHTVASEIMAGNGGREVGGRGGQENLRVASMSKMGAPKGACKSKGVDQGGGKGSVERH